MMAQIEDYGEETASSPTRTSWTWASLLAVALVGILMAGSAVATDITRDRCTSFTPESSIRNRTVNVQWQFRLCSTEQSQAAQLRFRNNTDKPLTFSFRLFTDEQHACETADDMTSVLTGSTTLTAGAVTEWPFPTVRLPEDGYRGRLWLCVFEARE